MNEHPEHRLRRPRNGRVVAGVVAGLAKYFGWNIFWARVLWILLGGLGGSGILLYAMLWLLIPSD